MQNSKYFTLLMISNGNGSGVGGPVVGWFGRPEKLLSQSGVVGMSSHDVVVGRLLHNSWSAIEATKMKIMAYPFMSRKQATIYKPQSEIKDIIYLNQSYLLYCKPTAPTSRSDHQISSNICSSCEDYLYCSLRHVIG